MGGIDLNHASCPQANEIVGAARFYTPREDGLRQPWSGRVWLNPPYGGLGPKFIARLADCCRSGAVEQACALLGTHHLTSKWFGGFTAFDPLACLPNGRLRFSGSETRPAHGSVVLGIGVDPEAFWREFAGFGPVWALHGRRAAP
jgi:hypothetical protein